jgi:hypothetical protein
MNHNTILIVALAAGALLGYSMASTLSTYPLFSSVYTAASTAGGNSATAAAAANPATANVGALSTLGSDLASIF